MTGRWHAALAHALTGGTLDLPETGPPDVAGLVSDLARAGWPAARVAEHARSVAADGASWPHPVPDALRAGCGAAQFAALLTAAREQLGLTALETRPPSVRRRLDADEQRLLSEVPPHHVG